MRQNKVPTSKPSAAKIEAEKRALYAENFKQDEQRAYERAHKATAIQAAKAIGKAAALKDTAKKESVNSKTPPFLTG